MAQGVNRIGLHRDVYIFPFPGILSQLDFAILIFSPFGLEECIGIYTLRSLYFVRGILSHIFIKCKVFD